MRTLFVLTAVIASVLVRDCDAQLMVSNSGDETIIMKYLSLSQWGKKMNEARVLGTSTVRVPLNGPDPYAVSYHFRGEDNQVGVHAKVGRPVPLNRLADSGEVFDIRASQAASQVHGRISSQTTSATLVDSKGRPIEIFGPPNTASDFARGVVNSSWYSQYRAISGRDVRATVDFQNLRYGQLGRFTDVLVSEDGRRCFISARWAFGDYRGDVFFEVSENSPNQMSGHYFTDGDAGRRLSWNANR